MTTKQTKLGLVFEMNIVKKGIEQPITSQMIVSVLKKLAQPAKSNHA